MSIIKTEAIVLKSDNYRGTSKLVTLYSKDYGKLKCIAKGVRDARSKWGGALQPMCCLNIIVYYKENKTLHLISNAEHKKLYLELYNDFEKTGLGYRMLELTNRTSAEQHPNLELYDLLKDSLGSLNNAPENFENIFIGFEFKLAKLLGINVDINFLKEKLEKKNLPMKRTGMISNLSNAVKEPVLGSSYNAGLINTLNSLKNGNFNLASEFNISKDIIEFLDEFFEGYFNTHFDHMGFLKAKKIIKE